MQKAKSKKQDNDIAPQPIHEPVLLREIMDYLHPQKGGVFIDATINGGGHATAIIKHIGKTGRLLGIDRDCAVLEAAKSIVPEYAPCRLVCDTFLHIRRIAEENGFSDANGILFDLGFSSFHIEHARRGFSFLRREPLDMRYNQAEGISAADIVNSWREDDIRNLLFILGEERYGRRIARRIVEERAHADIATTEDLVEIIRKAVPAAYRRNRIHFATRTFQALRIRVNDELGHVAKGVEDALSLLAAGGRIAVISFHSGEDRIIKELFRKREQEGDMRRITKKPVRADSEECRRNPRARSAKLRVLERI